MEDKNKLLNPIVSRFCDIYVPEIIDETNNIVHLGKSSKIQQPDHLNYLHEKMDEFSAKSFRTNSEIAELSADLYEKGLCALDVIEWINQNISDDSAKYSINMEFYRIKPELRSEKLLIFGILIFLGNLAAASI